MATSRREFVSSLVSGAVGATAALTATAAVAETPTLKECGLPVDFREQMRRAHEEEVRKGVEVVEAYEAPQYPSAVMLPFAQYPINYYVREAAPCQFFDYAADVCSMYLLMEVANKVFTRRLPADFTPHSSIKHLQREKPELASIKPVRVFTPRSHTDELEIHGGHIATFLKSAQKIADEMVLSRAVQRERLGFVSDVCYYSPLQMHYERKIGIVEMCLWTNVLYVPTVSN